MDCQLVKISLPDYIEGNVSADLKKEIQKHLDSCAECQSYSETVVDFLKALDTEKSIRVNPFLINRIEAKLHSNGAEQILPLRSRLIRTYSYYAAVIVIALGIGVYSGKQLGNMLNTNDKSVVITSESDQLKQDFYLNEIEKDDVSQVLNNQ